MLIKTKPKTKTHRVTFILRSADPSALLPPKRRGRCRFPRSAAGPGRTGTPHRDPAPGPARTREPRRGAAKGRARAAACGFASVEHAVLRAVSRHTARGGGKKEKKTPSRRERVHIPCTDSQRKPEPPSAAGAAAYLVHPGSSLTQESLLPGVSGLCSKNAWLVASRRQRNQKRTR